MSTTGNHKHRTIYVIDSQAVAREGVKRIIDGESELRVCGDSGEPEKVLRSIKQLKPDLILLDIAFDGTSRIELVRDIRKQLPGTRILIFSMCDENLYAERALRAGANGYLAKGESGKQLVSAIHQVLDGRTYVSEHLNERLLQSLHDGGSPRESTADCLSNRELEVFELIGKGFGTRDISEQLCMAKKTVETHRQHIRRKLCLKNTFELVQRAIHWVHRENQPAA